MASKAKQTEERRNANNGLGPSGRLERPSTDFNRLARNESRSLHLPRFGGDPAWAVIACTYETAERCLYVGPREAEKLQDYRYTEQRPLYEHGAHT